MGVVSGQLVVPVADCMCNTAYGSYDALAPSVTSGSVRVAGRVAVVFTEFEVALRNIVSSATTAVVVPVSEVPVPKTFGVCGERVIVDVADAAGQKATAFVPEAMSPFVGVRTSDIGGCAKYKVRHIVPLSVVFGSVRVGMFDPVLSVTTRQTGAPPGAVADSERAAPVSNRPNA